MKEKEFYSVKTIWNLSGRPYRSTTFFWNRLCMDDYIEECQRKGVEVLSIKHWRFVDDIPVPEVNQ